MAKHDKAKGQAGRPGQMECVMYAAHVAQVTPTANGGYTSFCTSCRTRIFFTADCFRELDRSGKIIFAQ